MPVDTSMYANIAQPANPLATMSNIAGLQGQMQQNQIMQRTMAAKQAIGKAMQAAVDPTTGAVDPNKFMSGVAADPDAAYGAEEAGDNANALNASQLAQHVQKVDLAMKQTAYLTNQLGALADKPGVSGKDVSSLAATLVQNGILDAKTAAAELAAAPTDDAKLPDYLRTLQLRALDSAKQLDLYHQNVMFNNGQTAAPVNVAPLATQPPIQMQLSPGEAATPVAGPVTPQGAPTTVPLGQRAKMGVVTTGLSPTQVSAGNVTGAGNAQRAQDLGKAASQVPDAKALLGNMTGDLSQFTSGTGAAQWKNFISGVNRIFPGTFDQNAVASQENFNKAQTLLAQRAFASLGGNSDKQLDSAIHGNPNEANSNLGNRGIIALNKGLLDEIGVQNQLWSKRTAKGETADTFGQFQNWFNQRTDPRIFQMQYLGAKEQQQVLSGMSAAERAEFYKKEKFAHDNGWIGGK